MVEIQQYDVDYRCVDIAFTFQIPSFKKVVFGGTHTYSKLSPEDQKHLLYTWVSDVKEGNLREVDYFYEKHADGRYHMHGTIYSSPYPHIRVLREQSLSAFPFNFKRLSQHEYIIKLVPIFNAEQWAQYCKKEQDQSNLNNLSQSIELESNDKYDTYLF